MKNNKDCWAGDVRLGLCLRSVAVLLTNVKLFNTNPPNDNTVFSHPCSKPITFHHMLVSQIEELYTLEIASRNSYLNGHITMEKLLSLWVTADPESDTIRNGDEYESTLSDNLQHCISTCKKDMGCMAYSFEHLSSKCTKQSKINALKKNIGTTTGIIRSNFKCRSEKHALEAKRLMVGL